MVEESQIQMSTAEFVKLVQRPLMEALQRVDRNLTEFKSTFDSALGALASRVDDLETWRTSTEATKETHNARDSHLFTRRQRVWAVVYAVSTLLVIGVVEPLIAHLLTATP